MKKFFAKSIILIAMMAISITIAFGQNNTSGNGYSNDPQNALPPTYVTINAYAPPPICSGTRNVTKIIAKVKWLWANGEVFSTREGDMQWLGGNLYTISFTCPSCAPAYIEYCLEGRDDFHYPGNGMLVAVTSKKEPSNYAVGDVFTILSNEWNGKCFGANLSIPICDK